MTELDEKVLSPSSDIEDPLSILASSFLIASGSTEKQQVSKEKLLDLIARAKLGDIEGLASEAQLSNREALAFARSAVLIDQVRDEKKSSFQRTTKISIRLQKTAARTTTTRQLLRTPMQESLQRSCLRSLPRKLRPNLLATDFSSSFRPLLTRMCYGTASSSAKEGGAYLRICKARESFSRQENYFLLCHFPKRRRRKAEK